MTTAKLDYLSYTHPDHTTPDAAMQRLGGTWRELGYGRNRYRSGAVTDDGAYQVYWDGAEPGMGVHVVVSGDGCRTLEEAPGFEWREWLGGLVNGGARVTRADLAIDDELGKIPFERVAHAVETRTCVRRGSSYQMISKFSGGKLHRTLYVGSRQSEVMMRVYDKGLQMGGTSWLRFETEWKGDRAVSWVNLLIEEGWDKAIAAVRGYFEFKDDDGGANRSRWPVSEWWEALMGSARHVLRPGELAAASLQKCMTWLARQCAPAIGVMLEVTGGDLSALAEFAESGRKRHTRRHRMMVAQGGWNAPAYA